MYICLCCHTHKDFIHLIPGPHDALRELWARLPVRTGSRAVALVTVDANPVFMRDREIKHVGTPAVRS